MDVWKMSVGVGWTLLSSKRKPLRTEMIVGSWLSGNGCSLL